MEAEKPQNSIAPINDTPLTVDQWTAAFAMMSFTLQDALQSWVKSASPESRREFAEFRKRRNHELQAGVGTGMSAEQAQAVGKLVKRQVDGMLAQVDPGGLDE